MKKMFSETGRWYRGNLHSHSTNSDGKLKPEEAVALYKKYGYHFLCLSEHDHFTDLSAQFDSPEFIILPGLEAEHRKMTFTANMNPGKMEEPTRVLSA